MNKVSENAQKKIEIFCDLVIECTTIRQFEDAINFYF